MKNAGWVNPPRGGRLGARKQSEECRLGKPPHGGMLGARKQSEECRVVFDKAKSLALKMASCDSPSFKLATWLHLSQKPYVPVMT